MRRLSWQIYLTIVGALVLFAMLAAAAWIHGPGLRDEMRLARALTVTVSELLPGPERPPEELQEAVSRLAERFNVEDIIDPRDTRPLLCEFADLAWRKLAAG